ncbi:hypothetical protein [Hoeflea sp.]|uniref:hypothetical protein n=1 Tax=Hoeflea sp. TaxID=1940281 RepID=UPI00374937E4
MNTLLRHLALIPTLALVALPLSGCGTYMVAKTVTGAGSVVVGGAVGAVKLTGKAAGTVVGVGRDEDED